MEWIRAARIILQHVCLLLLFFAFIASFQRKSLYFRKIFDLYGKRAKKKNKTSDVNVLAEKIFNAEFINRKEILFDEIFSCERFQAMNSQQCDLRIILNKSSAVRFKSLSCNSTEAVSSLECC